MKSKRILIFFLIFTLLFSFLSCGKQPSDEELIERASTLLSKSTVINKLFFEEGIPVTNAEPVNGYYSANKSELQALGFTSIASIKLYIREVWTEAFCQQMERTAIFSAVYGTSGVGSYAYCYDVYDDNGEIVGIKVSEDGLPIHTDSVEYLMDTIRVVSKTKSVAQLKIDIIVTNEKGESQNQTIKVKLDLDIDGEWRLSSYTCASYQYDKYPI